MKKYNPKDYRVNSVHAADHEIKIVPHRFWMPLFFWRLKYTYLDGKVVNVWYGTRMQSSAINFDPPVTKKEAYEALHHMVRSKVLLEKDAHEDEY